MGIEADIIKQEGIFRVSRLIGDQARAKEAEVKLGDLYKDYMKEAKYE